MKAQIYQAVRCLATLVIFLVTVSSMSGCNSSSEKPVNIDYSMLKFAPVKDSPLTTTSASEFGRYLKNGIRYRLTGYRGIEDIIGITLDSGDGSAFSTTNVHEIGVDEADKLKYDGSYLYQVQQTSNINTVPQGTSIRILETHASQATASEVAEIVVGSEYMSLSDIFLLPESQQLVAIANTQFHLWNSILLESDWSWGSGKTEIQLFDVSNPQLPEQEWKLEIEGNLEGSRRIGNILYLVTRYIPNLEDIIYTASTEEEKISNEKLILSTPISDLLPHYQLNDGAIRSLVNVEDCLLPTNTTIEEGYADVITLSAINLSTHQVESSLCLNTNVQGIYSSTSGFYIGGSSYTNFEEFSSFTEIHKFQIDAGSINYRASAAVPGRLGWSDPALRMSEKNADLRIVTTDFNGQDPEHFLSILRDDGSNNLRKLSRLPNASNPQAIGKEGEDIFSLRFVDDRAYIVTYERIDPLYVIDLSNPETPTIAGELEIPGFSRYLHPLSEGWLLGIGQDVVDNVIKGVKLELYDIRDMANPKLEKKLVFGNRYSYTEATSDLRSISLLALNEEQKRLAVPMEIWQQDALSGNSYWEETGLFLFDINGFVSNNLNLTFAGKMLSESASEEQPYPIATRNVRSVLHEDAVFYSHDNKIWSTLWGNWQQLNGPY